MAPHMVNLHLFVLSGDSFFEKKLVFSVCDEFNAIVWWCFLIEWASLSSKVSACHL